MTRTKSNEEFLEELSRVRQNEFIFLDSYVNARTKLRVRHNVVDCNHEWYVYPKSIINLGQGCPRCKCNKLRNSFALSFDGVKDYIENVVGYTLISNEYSNAKTKLALTCDKGHPLISSFNKIQQGQRCPVCVKERISGESKYPLHKIEELLLNNGIEIIKWLDEYKNRNSRFLLKCTKGHVHERSVGVFREYVKCPQCSLIEFGETHRGEFSGAWRGGTSSIIHCLRSCISEWKKETMRKSNYKCVVTGERFDDIHHLYGFDRIFNEVFNNTKINFRETIAEYSSFELDKLKNECCRLHKYYGVGVCLKKDLHVLFHQKYGYGDNTPEQFKDFLLTMHV